MRYTREEIAQARRLRELGLVWRPTIGDWFATDDGFISTIKGEGEASEVVRRHTWLPGWLNCRQWLRERGYSRPVFTRDLPGEVHIDLDGPDGRSLRGKGATDRECLYRIIAQLLVAPC